MNEAIKDYLRLHWISMLFSLAGSTSVFIIAIITLYVNFAVGYDALKRSVEANTSSQITIIKIHQQILDEIIQEKIDIATIKQEEFDNHALLEDIAKK